MKLVNIISEELNKFIEGVGDKYAERKWGIPDETSNNTYRPKDDLNGEFAGEVYDEYGKVISKIYKNPRSLKNFDKNCRAVSDYHGNIFVGQLDGDYWHNAIATAVQYGGKFQLSYAYDNTRNLTWHRIESTDDFGLSISSYKYTSMPENQEDVKERIARVEAVNPSFEFIPKYWEYITRGQIDNDETADELSMMESIVNEEIHGIVENISEYNHTEFKDVDNPGVWNFLRNRRFNDDANREYLKLFKAKDGKDYAVKKMMNEPVFEVYNYERLVEVFETGVNQIPPDAAMPIAKAVFDVQKDFFSGYKHNQSIKVDTKFQRLGMATAITDFAENIFGLPYKPTDLLSEPMQGFVQNRFKEGVGDKYAERKWGIPDETRSNVVAGQGVKANPDMGELVGIVYNSINGQAITNVYLNPRSLKEFDKNVRAVSDRSGNLFVAQFDGYYNHEGIGDAVLGYGKHSLKYVYDNNNNLTWHRIGNTNEFGFSITSIDAGNKDYYSVENQENRKRLLESKNPNFTFTFKYWEYIIDGDPYDGYELDNNYGSDNVNYDDMDDTYYKS